MKFYYETSFPTLHVQRNELASLPMKLGENKPHISKVLIDCVDKILSIKRNDFNPNTADIEAEIDQLIYQLYGLTPEEIAIVEEAGSISRL
jgi:hypothetical protein